MAGPNQTSRAKRKLALLLTAVLGVLVSGIPVASVSAAEPATVVLDWNRYAIEAVSNLPGGTPAGAGQPPPVGALHLAIVQAAVYDAVNAIDRTHEPYLRGLPRAPRSASKAAAAATAAHHVLVGLVPAFTDNIKLDLDGLYAASLATIPNGRKKTAGIRIGAAVAAAMLAKRANDGRFVPFSFTVGTEPGEWRPVLPLFVNDPFAWIGNVKPLAIRRASQFRTRGPLDLTSARYARELNEVKSLGSSTSTTRTPAQTELARFFTANPLVMMYKSYRDIAVAKRLSISRSARLLAMLSVSTADAMIGCWNDKAHWNFWRPITAIRLADTDGNPATTAQPDWLPFFPNPPYPDHPSGYNCFAGSMMAAGKAFFGTDRVRISLTNATLGITRTYTRLSHVVKDTINARIYLGFHTRTPDVQGAQLGRNTANWVTDRFFERDDDD
jgi:hypothetical protein